MTEKCFAKCANSKGSGQLDRNEQMCLGMCIDRYVDCMTARGPRPARGPSLLSLAAARTRRAPPQAVNEALVQRQQTRS